MLFRSTFATGSTRNHFTGTTHTGTTPFVFNSGAACRNYFQTVTINSAATDWLGLNAGVSNYIYLDDIEFTNALVNYINLPAFSNAFTIYHYNQNNGLVRYQGTGAANTTIDIRSGCVDGYVMVPNTYVGAINWNGAPFGYVLGSTSHPIGAITTQSDFDAISTYITDNNYDGAYVIVGFTPTGANAGQFARGDIIYKLTIPTVTTYVYWGRKFAQGPSCLTDKAGYTYTKSALDYNASNGWGSFWSTAATQTISSATTEAVATFTDADAGNIGVTVASSTRITTARSEEHTSELQSH